MLSLKNAANAEICFYRERVVSNSAEVSNFGAIRFCFCAIRFFLGAIKRVLCAIKFSWDKVTAR